MEHGPQDQKPGNHAPSVESGTGAAGDRRGGDAALLSELAGIDESLRERGGAWRELVQRLDALRREIAVAGAQAQRSRSLAARNEERDGAAEEEARPSAPDREQARALRLTQEFEAALQSTEKRRVALHAEMDDLRRRREALLRRLPAAFSRAYRPFVDAGRTPAIAAVVGGACGGCGSPLPEAVTEALGQGAVAACARCDRLLLPSEGGQ